MPASLRACAPGCCRDERSCRALAQAPTSPSISPIPRRPRSILRSAARRANRCSSAPPATARRSRTCIRARRARDRAPGLAQHEPRCDRALELARAAAAALPREFDAEIIEAHHRMKKDAPSGTALALGCGGGSGSRRAADRHRGHGSPERRDAHAAAISASPSCAAATSWVSTRCSLRATGRSSPSRTGPGSRDFRQRGAAGGGVAYGPATRALQHGRYFAFQNRMLGRFPQWQRSIWPARKIPFPPWTHRSGARKLSVQSVGLVRARREDVR
jgi:hypothetical protein